MAHLTKLAKYDIEDTNIALLGSDLEKRVREHAGDAERAWQRAGRVTGLQVWRIEKFNVVEWTTDRIGSFYDGDSYIVLHTYKKDPESDNLSYDLHFWLGENTTQDEAGTAAYKTVELDDHLYGLPVQYREVQGHESTRFLSYFPRFLCLQGGVATGFHHVSALPPLDIRKLYRITLAREAGRSSLIVREVPAEGTSLVRGDVFVLDKGNQVWQYNTKASAGQERYKAAEFVQSLINERKGQCDLTVYDEEGHRAGNFLSEFGLSTFPPDTAALVPRSDYPALLFRLSDSTGHITFEPITPVAPSTLSTDDVFLLDAASTESPAIYVWIGKRASHLERRLSFQYAQIYLYKKRADGEIVQLMTTLVKILEGGESDAFRKAMVSNT